MTIIYQVKINITADRRGEIENAIMNLDEDLTEALLALTRSNKDAANALIERIYPRHSRDFPENIKD